MYILSKVFRKTNFHFFFKGKKFGFLEKKINKNQMDDSHNNSIKVGLKSARQVKSSSCD